MNFVADYSRQLACGFMVKGEEEVLVVRVLLIVIYAKSVIFPGSIINRIGTSLVLSTLKSENNTKRKYNATYVITQRMNVLFCFYAKILKMKDINGY